MVELIRRPAVLGHRLHVDGFRFDLATTLARTSHGHDLGPGAVGHDGRSRPFHRSKPCRRTLGHRDRRLPGRQLPRALGGVERRSMGQCATRGGPSVRCPNSAHG